MREKKAIIKPVKVKESPPLHTRRVMALRGFAKTFHVKNRGRLDPLVQLQKSKNSSIATLEREIDEH